MDLAGINPGDILLAVDGRRLSGFDSEENAYEAIPEGLAGTSITFLVWRAVDGQTETIEITRAVLPEYPLFGSIEAPVPTGIEYRLDLDQEEYDVRRNWAVRVVSVVPNATDMILAALTSEWGIWGTPTPPEQGRQYFLATIRAEYLGPESDRLSRWELDVIGDATKTFYDAKCGDYPTISNTLPRALPIEEVIRGGVVEGAVCWEIDSQDAPTLKIRFESQVWAEYASLTVWYELSPSSPWHIVPTPIPTPAPTPTATPRSSFGQGGS